MQFLTRSPSNKGITRGVCSSVCPHIPPPLLLKEFQVNLVLRHRDVFPAVTRDISNCCQVASGDYPASCPVRISLSFYERKRLERENHQALPSTVSPWLQMEEYHFSWMIPASPGAWQMYFRLVFLICPKNRWVNLFLGFITIFYLNIR
jgi:hypothetical protein